MKCILFILIILYTFLLLKIKIKETFTDNQVEPLKPDDTQFYACHDNSFVGTGNTNYKLIHNQITPPLHGPYSEFLNEFGIRNYSHFFHAPICGSDGSDGSNGSDGEYDFDFKTDISGYYRPVYDDSDQTFKDEFMELERVYDESGLKDPFYTYYNPETIQNKITFSEEINELFLREFSGHVKEKKFRGHQEVHTHEITCDDIDGHGNPHHCPNPKRFRPEQVGERCTMHRSRSRHDGLDHSNDLEHCSDLCCQN